MAMHENDSHRPLNNLKDKITEGFKNIKKKLHVWRQRVRLVVYNTRLKLFLGRRSTWVAVAGYFIKYKVLYFSIVFGVVTLLVTWLSSLFTPPVNDATTFFTAASAMIGAALAIILTFNTLIINFAGTEYPPEFYKATGYDWRQNVIYFLLAADATALFVFCLVLKPSEQNTLLWLFPLAVFIICKAFYLLFASYLVTRKRLDPNTGLATIRKIAIKHLTKGAKAGDKLAKVFATNPNLKPEDRDVARKEAYRIMAPILEQVTKINGYLHDYHDKLLAKQNFAAASKVLDTIYALLVKYIEIRRDNMQARVTPYFLAFTTDSQGFFEENLQQLVDKAKRYIDAKNTAGAIHITDLMCSLAQHASTAEFNMRNENPLLDQVQGYVNSITDEAIAKNDIEVMFHLADVYSVLGRQAVVKNLSLTKSAVYGQLVKLGQKAAMTGETSISGRVAGAFNAILIELHNQGTVLPHMEPKQLIDEYQKILMLYCVSVTGDMSKAMITHPQMLAPYGTLLTWMGELARLPADNVDRRVHNTFTELAETIRRSMRSMSGTISLGDHSICVELGITIQSAANLMLTLRSKPEWQAIDSELINQTNWYIHQLTWFKEKTQTASEFVTRELADNAGHIGLRALETNTPEIAKASVEVISNLSLFFLAKAQKDNGYEPARFMEHACLVGVYAKKLGMDDVYELAKVKAVEFNDAFNRKHFPQGLPTTPDGRDYIGLHPDQLLRELDQLYEEANPEYGVTPDGILHTLQDKFGQYIGRDEVQAFIAELRPTPQSATPEPIATSTPEANKAPAKTVQKKPKKHSPRRKKKS